MKMITLPKLRDSLRDGNYEVRVPADIARRARVPIERNGQADGDRDAVGVAEEVVDAADEVAFGAADRFSVALPVAALFGEVNRGPRVVEDLGEREHAQRVVELTVPARVETVTVGAS